MKRWMQQQFNIDYTYMAEAFHIPEFFAKIMLDRGLKTKDEMNQFLCPDIEKMPDPREMKDIIKAADIIETHFQQNRVIAVIGDYDVDGIMSSYILIHGLQKMGARVIWRLPHRVKDGYGIRDYMADEMHEQGADLIITCDNGISAPDAISRAHFLNMQCIITDHHEIPFDDKGQEMIPAADAVIDPKQQEDTYSEKNLCGAGVAYCLISYMMKQKKIFREEDFLPFVALATICDVVPLLGGNRILAKNGIQALEDCQNVGLKCLIRLLEFKKPISSQDIGFRIGPCFNAAGRLEDASIGLKLLLAKTEQEANQYANCLVALNEERKCMTKDATEVAVKQVEKDQLLKQPVLIIKLPDCPESVAGIVAGRLREKYYRPVLVITKSKDFLKGSARSIPGYHMKKELEHCSDFLIEYGGHAMAAGFSMKAENYFEFYRKMNENCTLTEEDLCEKIYFDTELPLSVLDRNTIRVLDWLEPLGENNPGVVFARRNIKLNAMRIFGKEHQIGSFEVQDGSFATTMVDFHYEECVKKAVEKRYHWDAWNAFAAGEKKGIEIDVLYQAQWNESFQKMDYKIVDAR